jgi:hypothetical protein
MEPPPLPPLGNTSSRSPHPVAFSLGILIAWIDRWRTLLLLLGVGIVAICAVLGLLVLIDSQGSHAVQRWEFRVKEFDRELGSTSAMESELRELDGDGWEYVGPLCNNGINGHFVAFRRPKK